MSGRPKGYMDWSPQPHVEQIIDQVQDVLVEYSSYGAMTVRQIFYRLVGQYEYEKTERAYKRLAEYLVKARRSGMISFYSIRDDGGTELLGGGWNERSQFWPAVDGMAHRYALDHQLGQAQEVELWCEAEGMAPMLSTMTSEWSIPVYSTGGFSSVTVTKETADRVIQNYNDNGLGTVLLHVGDYDPSGESIFESMSQDIGAFVGGELGELVSADGEVEGIFTPSRVALTSSQVSEYDLPTAPPKASDSRSTTWTGETTQAEAMPPPLLEKVVKNVVLQYVDQDVLDEILEREASDRERLVSAVSKAREEDR